MPLRARSCWPLGLLPLLATCQTPVANGPLTASAALIDPLPIPDPPRIVGATRSDLRAIPLLPDDEALAGAICRDGGRLLPPGGTLFGHVRFDEAAATALVAPPASLAGGSCQQVHAAMVAPLAALAAAARAEMPEAGETLIALSCHRAIVRQTALFCDADRVAARGYAGQARWIAPPGYSEHATGLSVDFGARGDSACNLRPCFSTTPVGRWLAANAWRFGFELSFPDGNPQGVAHEPWHYRYIGDTATRALFDRAATLSGGIGPQPADQWTNRATTSR